MPFLDQIGGNDLSFLKKYRWLARRNQSARTPDHDEHHGKAEQQHSVLGRIEGGPENLLEEIKLTQEFGAANHQDGGNGDADLAAHTAEDHDAEDGCRLDEGERFR